MKKVYLTFVVLFFISHVYVFGQLFVRVETAPTLYLPPRFNKSAGNYINPYQLFYKNGQFLRLKMGKFFYVGIGIQEEQLYSCADCLQYKKPERQLQLTEEGYNYVVENDSCTARLLGRTRRLFIPMEIGYTYHRKKSPLGLNINARIYGFGRSDHRFSIRGDTVSIDDHYTLRHKSLFKYVNWQLAAGASYRLNKRTFLSADLAWSTYWLRRDQAIGLNIGLDYALTKP